jgi:hypothetical protein
MIQQEKVVELQKDRLAKINHKAWKKEVAERFFEIDV